MERESTGPDQLSCAAAVYAVNGNHRIAYTARECVSGVRFSGHLMADSNDGDVKGQGESLYAHTPHTHSFAVVWDVAIEFDFFSFHF